jgi:hypothetical protein
MLVQDIQEVSHVARTSKAISYESIAPHLNNAQNAFIIPTLGKNMFQALDDFHKDHQTPKITSPEFNLLYREGEISQADHAYRTLLWFAQHAMVNLCYFIGFDVLNAYISDQGFRRQESETVKSMFKYQEDSLKKYFHETGMNSIDVMLEILETNIDFFPEFEAQYALLKSRIIPDTKTFGKHYHINNSRVVFMRLRQHMKLVEELDLEPVLGKANLVYVLTELAKPEPAAKVQLIMPYLRDPVAFLATARLMEETGAEITERGLYYTGLRSIMDSGLNLPTDEPRVKDLVERNKRLGQEYLARLRKFMMQNDWEMPEGPRSRMMEVDNAGRKTFWV